MHSILIAEDTPETRELYAIIFEEAGYEVITAESMSGALSVLRGRHFDVLLTDYSLGDGTALGLLECAAAEKLLEGTPAVICTAHAHVSAPHDVAVLHKPIAPEELLRAVRHQEVRAVRHN